MPWNVYRVVFRLRAPLHIGQGKINYLQRTRPYVTGRVFRGALVSRVGRNQPELVRGSPSRDPYRRISKTFAQYLTSTYFYPALKNGDGWQPAFLWKDDDFRRRFLGSYAGAALAYPQQTAAEGQLREIEFISPRTLDKGEQVYLLGYIFAQDENLKKYDWRAALHRLQLGGERGYGWGLAELATQPEPVQDGEKLFEEEVGFGLGQKRPVLYLKKGAFVWAHVQAQGTAALTGPIEPLVGREWRGTNRDGTPRQRRHHIGQHLAFNGLCYTPGSRLTADAAFSIEEGGVWKQVHH